MSITQIPVACVLGVRAEPARIDVDFVPAPVPVHPGGRVATHVNATITSRQRFGRDAAERVDAALRATGLQLAAGAYTFELVVPASVPGGDRHLDLAVAVGAVAAGGGLPDGHEQWMVAAELALDGTLRPLRGAVLVAAAASEMGLKGIVVPRANLGEAALMEGVEVRGADTLGDVIAFLRGDRQLDLPVRPAWPAAARSSTVDFAEVKGQEHVKRALEVAAAGFHHVLLVGTPGCGKTMLAQRLPTILPAFSRAEMLEVTRIYSAAGLLHGGTGCVAEPPFRCPHMTISDAGLVGGGSQPRPGEASLAHRGVLFMDELAEFRRTVLEALRHPLEEQRVALARAGMEIVYPAAFLLVAAMNPCPCGYHGDSLRRCTCSPEALMRYRARVPEPLFDLIDMHVEVPAVRYRELADRRPGEPSEAIRARVESAREVQRARFAGRPGVQSNAAMSVRDVGEFCKVGEGADALLRTAINRLALSARAYHRVLKLARTIADLDGDADITTGHVAEAIQYRSLDRGSSNA